MGCLASKPRSTDGDDGFDDVATAGRRGASVRKKLPPLKGSKLTLKTKRSSFDEDRAAAAQDVRRPSPVVPRPSVRARARRPPIERRFLRLFAIDSLSIRDREHPARPGRAPPSRIAPRAPSPDRAHLLLRRLPSRAQASHPGYYLTPKQATALRPFLSRVVLKQLAGDLRRAPPFEGERIPGVALVVDVSGFTKLEISLNAKGNRGIEEFGETLHAIFDVLVHIVVEAGAFLHWSPYDRVGVVNADP